MAKQETLNYVGIDNGISGAVVVLHGRDVGPWLAMPVQKSRKGNEIDVRALYAFLCKSIPEQQRPKTVVCVEEPGGAQSYTAAVSMAASFHAIRATLDLMQLRWHRITPATWQKVMLPGCKKGNTKPMALEVVRRMWPEEHWLPTARSSTPNTGAVDAVLIAEYARMKQL